MIDELLTNYTQTLAEVATGLGDLSLDDVKLSTLIEAKARFKEVSKGVKAISKALDAILEAYAKELETTVHPEYADED